MINYNINITFVMNRNILLITIQDKFKLPETIERSLLKKLTEKETEERMEGAALKHQMLYF